MKKKNNYLYDKRLQILKFAKIIISKQGLKSDILKIISTEYNLDNNQTYLLFPDGNNDLIKFSLEQLNKDLKEYCKEIDLIRLPIHKRIRKILLSKIYLMNKEKKFYKKIFFNVLIPQKNFSLPKQLYKSVDQIWYISGDSSVNFNFYTKRLILSGIYSRILIFFFNNNDQEALENLLDANLKLVSKIPKIKSKFNMFNEYFPKILNFVKNSN